MHAYIVIYLPSCQLAAIEVIDPMQMLTTLMIVIAMLIGIIRQVTCAVFLTVHASNMNGSYS